MLSQKIHNFTANWIFFGAFCVMCSIRFLQKDGGRVFFTSFGGPDLMDPKPEAVHDITPLKPPFGVCVFLVDLKKR